MDKDAVAMRLELIACKAKQLSHDVKNGKLWEGELGQGLSEIRNQLDYVSSEARDDR